MGAELPATLTYKRRVTRGKALLESTELIFRGEDRLRIPFAAITALKALDGRLSVSFDGGTAVFEIGPKAAQWMEKIRSPKTLIDKLGIKEAHRVVVLGVKDAEFAAQLAARASDVSTRARKDADVVVLQADTPPGLARLTALRGQIKRDGMIWTVTPKGKGGIKDTDVIAAGKRAGLVDVKIAAFSATHTATKFVIPKAQR